MNWHPQMQVLRLTTPNLHPQEQKSLFGDPGKAFGAPFAQDDRFIVVRTFDSGH